MRKKIWMEIRNYITCIISTPHDDDDAMKCCTYFMFGCSAAPLPVTFRSAASSTMAHSCSECFTLSALALAAIGIISSRRAIASSREKYLMFSSLANGKYVLRDWMV